MPKIKIAYFRVRYLFVFLFSSSFWFPILKNPNAWTYATIFTALYMQEKIGLNLTLYGSLILFGIACLSYAAYLLERNAFLREYLKYEQIRVVLMEKQIAETLWHKKELQYKIDKLITKQEQIDYLPLAKNEIIKNTEATENDRKII